MTCMGASWNDANIKCLTIRIYDPVQLKSNLICFILLNLLTTISEAQQTKNIAQTPKSIIQKTLEVVGVNDVMLSSLH